MKTIAGGIGLQAGSWTRAETVKALEAFPDRERLRRVMERANGVGRSTDGVRQAEEKSAGPGEEPSVHLRPTMKLAIPKRDDLSFAAWLLATRRLLTLWGVKEENAAIGLLLQGMKGTDAEVFWELYGGVGSLEATLRLMVTRVDGVRPLEVSRDLDAMVKSPGELPSKFLGRFRVALRRYRVFHADMEEPRAVRTKFLTKLPVLGPILEELATVDLDEIARRGDALFRFARQGGETALPTTVMGAQEDRVRCAFCARRHPAGRSNCPAMGKECLKCGGEDHFAACCKA